MPFSPVSLQETPCSIFTASPKYNLPSPHCTLYPGRLQPYSWIQACTVNPKSAFLASSRSKTTHLSHSDSLFSYPKVISTKGKQRQRKKKHKIIVPPKLKSLQPALPLPVTAPPYAPPIGQEMWESFLLQFHLPYPPIKVNPKFY